MSDRPPQDQIASWILGELSPGELLAFEEAMRRDPALRAEAYAQREAMAELALGAPMAPSEALRRRVLAAAAAAPGDGTLPFPAKGAPSSGPRPLTWFALAASVLLAIALGATMRSGRRALDGALAARDSVATLLAARDSLLAELTNPALETVTLVANQPAQPLIQVLMDRDRRRAMLSAAALPAIGDDRAYQLWFIVDGTPQASVTFRPGTGGRALALDVAMPASGTIQAVAVTLEPRAGSAQPTLPVLYSAPLGE